MKALITGVTGQDGSYLAELLLAKGYEVHGLMRRASLFNSARIDHIFNRLHLHHGDMLDASSLRRVLARVMPDEVYHLAAQSHVRVSFDEPEYTHAVNAMGTLTLLEAVRAICPEAKVYNASSSEMFGNAPAPQTITTPFAPISPYGIAKLAAHNHAVMYREAYGMFVCNGILFNHESPRRGPTFVTRKITMALGRRDKTIELGNLDARRDWGFAGDYVRAMWTMLQGNEPKDYIVATEEDHSVRDFLWEAQRIAGHTIDMRETERLRRPREVNRLKGIPNLPGWRPTVDFGGLVKMMVEADRA